MCKCGEVFNLIFIKKPFRFFVVITIIVLCLFDFSSTSQKIRIKKEIVDDSVQRYLMRFGYMPPTPDGEFALRTEESIRDAIKELQQFAGIPPTGRLDQQTTKLLNTPRCGVPDRNNSALIRRRRRFLLHGPKWPFTNLTWSLRSKYLRNLSIYEVRYVISKALEVWSRHSKLTFTEVDSDKADILIYFYSRDHGDKFPFDGKGVILAHAFFPNDEGRSIEVHFDADEQWTTSPTSDEGTNLFNVAAHEFGHSLGLSHSSIEGALMYPWYKEMENGFDYELPEDDRLGIQTLYGARVEKQWDTIKPYKPPTITTTTTTTTPPPPRIYPTQYYRPRYPHHGSQDPRNQHPHYPGHRPQEPYPGYNPHNQYPGYNPQPPYNPHHRPQNPYKPHHTKKPMHPDHKHYPKQYPYNPERRPTTRHVERTTPHYLPVYPDKHPDRRYNSDKESREKRPPDTCDTSYDSVAVIRREVFIFKDAYFWRIGDNNKLQQGYPAEIIRLWKHLPRNLTHVDAVYERPDSKIVFFIDDLYYLFTGDKLESGYPKPLTELGLPPSLRKIDGAMVWGHNGKTYFYSGSLYWRFDEDTGKVELDYPRDMSMWKGVGTDIDAVFQWKDGKTYFFKGKGFWKFNDLHMRVEHEEQKPSGPFWMGCSSNLEGNDIGNKLPYKDNTPVSSASSLSIPSALFIWLWFIYLTIRN